VTELTQWHDMEYKFPGDLYGDWTHLCHEYSRVVSNTDMRMIVKWWDGSDCCVF